MRSAESKNSRPPSVSCTPEQIKTSESQRFFAGLKTPWEKFHRSQTERLSRIAAEMRMPPDRIADVLQEVWLDLIEHSEGFQGEDAERRLSSWLVVVVRSKVRDALRRLKRRRAESLGALPEEPVDHKAENPEKRMEAEERSESVGAKLEELRKESRLNCRLVHEHILEDRSLRDLAAETGLDSHAISCRIGRSLKKLRRGLRE